VRAGVCVCVCVCMAIKILRYKVDQKKNFLFLLTYPLQSKERCRICKISFMTLQNILTINQSYKLYIRRKDILEGKKL
jgi:hypothetical protein